VHGVLIAYPWLDPNRNVVAWCFPFINVRSHNLVILLDIFLIDGSLFCRATSRDSSRLIRKPNGRLFSPPKTRAICFIPSQTRFWKPSTRSMSTFLLQLSNSKALTDRRGGWGWQCHYMNWQYRHLAELLDRLCPWLSFTTVLVDGYRIRKFA
jgi:hypothetical protein